MCSIEPTQRRIGRSLGLHQADCEIDMEPERVNFRIFGACAAAVALLLMATSVTTADSAPLPSEQHAGTVNYRSGGVGIESSDAMKAEAASYSLAMTFTSHVDSRDAYTVPSHLSIVKAGGSPVLDIRPDGPYLLVDLPAGKYQVTADVGGASKTLAVEIVAGVHQKLAFELAQVDASR